MLWNSRFEPLGSIRPVSFRQPVEKWPLDGHEQYFFLLPWSTGRRRPLHCSIYGVSLCGYLLHSLIVISAVEAFTKIIVTYILCGSTVQLVEIHPGHNYSYFLLFFLFFIVHCGGQAWHAFVCKRTSNTHSDSGVTLTELPLEGQVTFCLKKLY